MSVLLSDIRANVQANVERPSTDSAAFTRFINQAIREIICARHNWQSMETQYVETLVAGTEAYAFQTATIWKDVEMILVRNSATENYEPLVEVSEAIARQYFTDTTTAGRGYPKRWWRRGASFKLRPIPDQAYGGLLVIGWAYPADLSADSDHNDFTDYYSRLVELWATSRAYLQYGEDQKAQIWRQYAEVELQRTIADDKRRMDPARQTLNPKVGAGGFLRRRRGPIQATTPYFGWP